MVFMGFINQQTSGSPSCTFKSPSCTSGEAPEQSPRLGDRDTPKLGKSAIYIIYIYIYIYIIFLHDEWQFIDIST